LVELKLHEVIYFVSRSISSKTTPVKRDQCQGRSITLFYEVMRMKGCRTQDVIFIGVIHSGHESPDNCTPVAADNTLWSRDGEGLVAESIAALAI